MPRKLFTAPTSQFITGENARPIGWILRSLNEYFKRHIGFWGVAEGTTDVDGNFVFTHNCGFEPVALLVTEENVTGPSHDMGPFHVETFNSETADIHFLRKTGNPRDEHAVKIYYLLLPSTER